MSRKFIHPGRCMLYGGVFWSALPLSWQTFEGFMINLLYILLCTLTTLNGCSYGLVTWILPWDPAMGSSIGCMCVCQVDPDLSEPTFINMVNLLDHILDLGWHLGMQQDIFKTHHDKTVEAVEISISCGIYFFPILHQTGFKCDRKCTHWEAGIRNGTVCNSFYRFDPTWVVMQALQNMQLVSPPCPCLFTMTGMTPGCGQWYVSWYLWSCLKSLFLIFLLWVVDILWHVVAVKTTVGLYKACIVNNSHVVIVLWPYLSHFWSDLDALGLILNITGSMGYTPANH